MITRDIIRVAFKGEYRETIVKCIGAIGLSIIDMAILWMMIDRYYIPARDQSIGAGIMDVLFGSLFFVLAFCLSTAVVVSSICAREMIRGEPE